MEVSLSYLPYLAARVTNTPLMVDNSKLETILSVIGSRIGIDTTKAPSLFGLTREPGGLVITPTGIGIVPIFGTLLKRSSNLNATSGLLSYATIEEMIQEAANNPKVEGLLLDIDSPGGEVGGVFDLAAMIRDVGTDKPIWALADDAFSAAYLIASAAHRIILPQTAGVGSVGVIAVHVDESQRDAKEGRQYTTVFSGSRKNDFSSHASLSDDAQDRLQKEVDRIYGLFVGAVAQGRNMSEAAICATEASLFFGTDAVTAGLADQVGTLRDALADLTSQIDQTKRITFHAAATPLVSKHEEKPMATEEPAVKKTATIEQPTTLPDAPSTTTEAVSVPGKKSNPQPPPSSTPVSVPSSTPAPTAEVIDLDQVRSEKEAQMRQQAEVIVELCALANQSSLAGEFIAKGTDLAAVRKDLLARRASEPEIHSHVMPGDGTRVRPEENLEANPVVVACQKLAKQSTIGA